MTADATKPTVAREDVTSSLAASGPIDTQAVEILGRGRLVEELVRAEIEVAIPVRDRGVDLVAYVERKSEVERFSTRPI